MLRTISTLWSVNEDAKNKAEKVINWVGIIINIACLFYLLLHNLEQTNLEQQINFVVLAVVLILQISQYILRNKLKKLPLFFRHFLLMSGSLILSEGQNMHQQDSFMHIQTVLSTLFIVYSSWEANSMLNLIGCLVNYSIFQFLMAYFQQERFQVDLWIFLAYVFIITAKIFIFVKIQKDQAMLNTQLQMFNFETLKPETAQKQNFSFS